MLNNGPYHTFADRSTNQQSRDPMFVNLPMMAIYSGRKSIRDLNYEQLILRLKDTSTKNMKKFVSDLKKELDIYSKKKIKIYIYDTDTLNLVDMIVGLIFDLVIFITMFLCLFALSSSMSANLYE